MTPLLLLTIAVILGFFSLISLTISLHCLKKANAHLAKAMELHLDMHEEAVRIYGDQFGLPPEDWEGWGERPDR